MSEENSAKVMAEIVAEPVIEVDDVLGECPLWNALTGEIVWIDITRRLVHSLRLTDLRHEQVELGYRPGAIALRAGGGFVIAAEHCFLELDRLDAAPRIIAELSHLEPDVRMNDGECDPQGRFWAGTSTDDGRSNAGTLFRLDPDHSVTPMLAPVTVSNGLAWSPEQTVLYYVDTASSGVDAFAYDAVTGSITNRRRIIEIDASLGYPDGLAVDSDGYLWVALWKGGAIHRYSPCGTIDRVVRVPTRLTTSCCFGGPNLDQLFVTSARSALSPTQLLDDPLAGSLFSCSPGVAGLPSTTFRGN